MSTFSAPTIAALWNGEEVSGTEEKHLERRDVYANEKTASFIRSNYQEFSLKAALHIAYSFLRRFAENYRPLASEK